MRGKREGATAGVWLAAVVVLAACGGSTPAAPTPPAAVVSSPTPAPTPVPTPTPAPSPSPSEEPVFNTNPPVRLNLRLYVIEDPGGGYISNPSPDQVPVGYTARIDVIAKDADNRETVGRGPIEFFFHNPALVRVWGNHTHQRRVQGLGPGQVDCWAIQDGVRSNTLTLTFVR